ncbi:uncharacterized protein N7479_003645 [Penicillium vulpinum]|uniref:AB hydrolase-1 domain-containing protein n=1 Tax=Penicillium vulpinum TaxID=29845 RepID=A0A1V6R8H5_9EURO|nr:uncharacterized protein N7479_003645 [Penicillium vulpinum]KAJ5963769.1 hypothetical protein N7479_003645 [Penicillium vulpinum]OQD97864.1 hypothetical protein PENVUL_c080G08628 [Penicillium vulpinum]
MSKFWPKGGLPGILHHYTETLVTFEYASSKVRQPHSILFVGGLGDGLATTSYMADLARALQHTEWSLFTLNLTSSYQSWGLGHLDRDTNEIAQCLEYIRSYKADKFGGGKIALMGHSTGSQCVLHYLSQSNPHTKIPAFDAGIEHITRPVLDGAIMQAPVSDREAIFCVLKGGIGETTPEKARAVYDEMEALALAAVAEGKPHDTMLPLSLTSMIYPANTPISCRRFLSLVSPESPQTPQEDDLFSSDLSDEHFRTTFGMIQERGLLNHKLMVLISGKDQSIPDWVDMNKILARWQKATDHDGKYQIWDEKYTGIIPNASHALSNDDQAEPRKFLVERVLGYLKTVVEKP